MFGAISKTRCTGLLPPSFRRFLVVSHTVQQNWREDPVKFLLNAQIRRGNRVSTALIKNANRVCKWIPSRSRALIALLAGDRGTLDDQLQRGLKSSLNARAARQFADIALAADLRDLAERFMSSIPPGARGANVTHAKVLWYGGHMTEAIAVLEDDGERAGRLLDRYRAEADVFNTWVPKLPHVKNFVPDANVVLHLLTNSLPYTESGYAQRTHSLLREQVSAGWQVHAATRLGYPQNIGAMNSNNLDVIDGVYYHRLVSNGQQGNLRLRQQRQAETLLDLAVRLRPIVLHTTTDFVNGLAVRAVAEALGLPWVYEVRGQLADTWASKRGYETLLSERYLSFQRREAEVASAADGVITLGKEMSRILIEAGVDSENIALAPNGVGEDFLETPVSANVARELLDLPRNDIHIGTISSLVSYEGLDCLIDAFVHLTGHRSGLRLLIVGDGAEAPALKRQVEAAGLNPSEVLPGRVPREKASIYHQALDIFVVPRQDLTVTRAVTPLKPVEAMASARPVVASNLPALREIVVDGYTGIMVRPGDVNELATALKSLVDNAELRAVMGAESRALVLEERTWALSVNASLEHYARLARHASLEALVYDSSSGAPGANDGLEAGL